MYRDRLDNYEHTFLVPGGFVTQEGDIKRATCPRGRCAHKARAKQYRRQQKHSDEHFAVTRLHARWQELAGKSGSRSGEQSKEIRELEAQIKSPRNKDANDEEAEVLEARLAEAKAKTP